MFQSTTDCENSCQAKNLFSFQVDDFYNFADRLNQSNFLSPSMASKNDSSEIQDPKFQKGEFEIYFTKFLIRHEKHYTWVHFSVQFRISHASAESCRSTHVFDGRPQPATPVQAFDPSKYASEINDHVTSYFSNFDIDPLSNCSKLN